MLPIGLRIRLEKIMISTIIKTKAIMDKNAIIKAVLVTAAFASVSLIPIKDHHISPAALIGV